MVRACWPALFAYNTAITRSGWRLKGRPRSRHRAWQGFAPGSQCLRSFGSFGPFRAARAASGPKGALRRIGHRNGRKGRSMPLYEHVFLARQDISQAQVEALTKEYSDVITEGGGKVGKTEYWGLKTVAFKIKKNRKAHYSLMNLEAPPAAIAEMERRMGLSPDVIRFITIRVDEHETEPSIQMRKTDRDERGRDGDRVGGFRGDPGCCR